jgi:hypothetical protein
MRRFGERLKLQTEKALISNDIMNLKSIVILIFILPISIFCQIDRTRSWYFGEGLKIFFTKDNQLNVRTDLKGNTGEGTGVFNDSVGNLLFYSDWGSVSSPKIRHSHISSKSQLPLPKSKYSAIGL